MDGVLKGRVEAVEKLMEQRRRESRPESCGSERSTPGPGVWVPGEGSLGPVGFVS